MNRWITYQRERFPLAGHGPLVAAFSVSAVCFSRLVRGEAGFAPARPLIVAFTTALLFFLQLRIADEFKDFDEDSRYRPYRPVPRGLITLRELGWVAAGAAVMQFALACWLDFGLLPLLALAWAYLALMSREFFIADWLREHPLAYMVSHMVIIPLIDLYATAADWVPSSGTPPQGLIWFLLVSYVNGVVVEIGRKIRVPEDEEPGVETYSALWGRATAIRAWLLAIGVTAVLAWQAARRIDFEAPVVATLILLVAGCALAAWRFASRRTRGAGKTIEIASGVWTLVMYLSLGLVPAVFARSVS